MSFAFAYGQRNLQNLAYLLKRGRARELSFVELMACPSGCLNGGGQMLPVHETQKGGIATPSAHPPPPPPPSASGKLQDASDVPDTATYSASGTVAVADRGLAPETERHAAAQSPKTQLERVTRRFHADTVPVPVHVSHMAPTLERLYAALGGEDSPLAQRLLYTSFKAINADADADQSSSPFAANLRW